MATTSPMQDAGRVRRWVSRILVAAGGAAVATVFAWVLTTASASASEGTQQLDVVADAETAVEAPETLEAPGATPAVPAEDSVDCPAEAAAERFRAAHPKLAEAGERAHRFWHHRVVEPTGKALESVGRLLTPPELPRNVEAGVWPDLGQRDGDVLDLPPLGEFPVLPGQEDGAGAEPGLPTAHEAVLPEVPGTSESRPESTPDRSTGYVADVAASDDATTGDVEGPRQVQLPVVPQPDEQAVPSPLPSHTSTSNGLHLDSPLVAIPAGMGTVFADAAAGSLRPGVRSVSTHPGAQPGVTPD